MCRLYLTGGENPHPKDNLTQEAVSWNDVRKPPGLIVVEAAITSLYQNPALNADPWYKRKAKKQPKGELVVQTPFMYLEPKMLLSLIWNNKTGVN